MSLVQSRIARIVASALALGMLDMALPAYALKLSRKDAPQARQVNSLARAETRPLTLKEMRNSRGKTGENPYISGAQKWSAPYEGVDLVTGNFSFSVSDLSFEGGYGIPVAITRTYSSNNGDEGPFGKGWSLSVDIRTTAGGILKSPAAPVRSV